MSLPTQTCCWMSVCVIFRPRPSSKPQGNGHFQMGQSAASSYSASLRNVDTIGGSNPPVLMGNGVGGWQSSPSVVQSAFSIPPQSQSIPPKPPHAQHLPPAVCQIFTSTSVTALDIAPTSDHLSCRYLHLSPCHIPLLSPGHP